MSVSGFNIFLVGGWIMFKHITFVSGKISEEKRVPSSDKGPNGIEDRGMGTKVVLDEQATEKEDQVDVSNESTTADNVVLVNMAAEVNSQEFDSVKGAIPEQSGRPLEMKNDVLGQASAFEVSDRTLHDLSNLKTSIREHDSERTASSLSDMSLSVDSKLSAVSDSNKNDILVKANKKLNDQINGIKSLVADASGTSETEMVSASSTDEPTARHEGSNARPSDCQTGVSRKGCTNVRSDSIDSSVSGALKPHTGGDGRWEAIQFASSRDSPLGLGHFALVKRVGFGDIGSVYLAKLRGTSAFFAMKVMDKASLVSRNKLLRAQTERDILSVLDHPFLPTLYSHFETDKYYCFVMEYCSGGNLHSLRQKQPNKYFTEQAARFYAAEVLLALEYLHMLGIVYRDLKPENVLVRDGGHIMLSDFDLSLRCSVNPTLVKSSSVHGSGASGHGILDGEFPVTGCMHPATFFPRILPKKNRKSKSDFGLVAGALELMAEPTNARSMSFVGTHEYLAPEIICGEGHGSAVDWWTFGIFLYELLHGTTPFKGTGNRATLFNVVGQPLRFPDASSVSLVARDLIRSLLVKDPQKRIAYRRGATEIKQHPFFDGVNWALIRCNTPPHVPDPVDFSLYKTKDGSHVDKKEFDGGGSKGGRGSKGSMTKSCSSDSCSDFEYF